MDICVKLSLKLELKAWAFGYVQYVKADVNNVGKYFWNKFEVFPSRAMTSLSNRYHPEIDVTEELGADES